jgi:hypothetical protein
MVSSGSELWPLRRCSASISSLLLTVRSSKGMPRVVSSVRAALQGAQSSLVYSVTGIALCHLAQFVGQPAVLAERGWPPCGPAAGSVLAVGARSEKVTLPFLSTLR